MTLARQTKNDMGPVQACHRRNSASFQSVHSRHDAATVLTNDVALFVVMPLTVAGINDRLMLARVGSRRCLPCNDYGCL